MSRRTPTLALTVLAVVCLSAVSAEAATIHACVKPKSGATRIVSAKAKCRRGETKLSWSTTGPRGAGGPAGPAGVTGPSGIGPAFVVDTGEAPLTEVSSLLFTKTIPPGAYVLDAQASIRGHATVAEKLAEAGCTIVEKAGTSLAAGDLTGGATKIEGLGGWESPLAKDGANEYTATTTMTLVGASESKVTSTIGLVCGDDETPSGVTVVAVFSDLIATQVSSIA